MSKGETEKAEKLLKEEFDIKGDLYFLKQLGRLYLSRKEYGKAKECFEVLSESGGEYSDFGKENLAKLSINGENQ